MGGGPGGGGMQGLAHGSVPGVMAPALSGENSFMEDQLAFLNPLNQTVARERRGGGRVGLGVDGDDLLDDRESMGDSDSLVETSSIGQPGYFPGGSVAGGGTLGQVSSVAQVLTPHAHDVPHVQHAHGGSYGHAAPHGRIHLGLGMPALAVHHPPPIATEAGMKLAGKAKAEKMAEAMKAHKAAVGGTAGGTGGTPHEGEEQEEVVLYFGIIDILQVRSLRPASGC